MPDSHGTVYAPHKLLWQLRRDPALAERFRAGPDRVLASYDWRRATARRCGSGRDGAADLGRAPGQLTELTFAGGTLAAFGVPRRTPGGPLGA
jgi:hypothetical protein